jgi:uncharacterized protein YdbL (DUF1318 family)
MSAATILETSVWSQVWALVSAEWHDEFRHFVDTGQASNEFLAYLDEDADCQAAVDLVIDAQAEAFQKLAEVLRAPVE